MFNLSECAKTIKNKGRRLWNKMKEFWQKHK